MKRNQLYQLTLMRLILFWREPEAVFWVFLFPLILALVLGFAFKNRGVEPSRVGVISGVTDDRWIAALDSSASVETVRFVDGDVAAKKLRTGGVEVLVLDGDPIVLRLDPTRPEAETARLRIHELIQRDAGQPDLVPTTTEPITERGSRYIDFLIPGLLGMNLMGTGMWGTGFAIVDMRQKKLLKRFLVTPMRRSNLMLGQMLSRLAFLVMEVSLITAFGALVLGVPFRGAVGTYALFCVLGALVFSGLGLLTASRVRTIEGASGLMNFVMMPMWLLSGVFFSYERFPEFLHPFIRALPLTALNDALRGLMLEGDRLLDRGPELAVLTVWTLGSFAVALRIFRWR